MSITFRNYSTEPLFTEDYRKVREFLIRINRTKLVTPHYTWGRWEWMTTHGGLDRSGLGKIGLWEDSSEIVAIVTYDCRLGEAFFCIDEAYTHLKPDMLKYARKNFAKDGKFQALIGDNDRDFQRVAISQGFRPTQRKEHYAVIDINDSLTYTLPDGFSIVSMADDWDYYKYDRVMWRGFNHEGPPPQTDEDIACRRQMLSSPAIIPEVVISVAAPDGRYVSHCGMWYMPGDDYAYVEPVATDPDFRNMGFGKAAVLEGVIRCGKLGAKQAIVGSSQQFYYSIGFYPIHTETGWEQKGQ